MANRSTELGRFIRAGEEKLARRRVAKALQKTSGNVLAASRLLSISRHMIWRLIHRLALEEVVAEARASRVHPGGHPPGLLRETTRLPESLDSKRPAR